ILYASDAFCSISQYNKDEILGKPQNIVRHPDMKKELFKNLWETIQSGKSWMGEIKNLSKDGKYYWTDSLILPEFDNNGNIISYISIRHDITAKKDLEKEKEKIFEQSKLASMGQMLGNIAHQWRQPLSVITVATSGLQLFSKSNQLTDKKIDDFSNIIMSNATYLSSTIETFRNFIKEKKELKKISIQERIDFIT
ncbi:PAS domain-containing protein, partial [Arcobacter sp.]|uniref:PAS domain-containing protein n=1 Tax=Arcobacter sp. TaxID=1872629 RepID=UPI003D0EB5B2